MFQQLRIKAYSSRVSAKIAQAEFWRNAFGAFTPLYEPFEREGRGQEYWTFISGAYAHNMPIEDAADICWAALVKNKTFNDAIKEHYE